MIVRWLICVATAVCLLAAPGARPDAWRADAAHLEQAPAHGHAPVQRAPMIATATELALPAPARVAIARTSPPSVARVVAHPPAICSRGPPET